MVWRRLRSRFRQKPLIHLYTISWNEERMLPFFFRHYDSFVERYVFYDDASSDSTLEMLKAHPRVEIRTFERTTRDSFVASQQSLQNSMWKESRGACDWVILTAVDEHLYHPDLSSYLVAAKRKGVTAVPALGYEMVSTAFPADGEHLASVLTRGIQFRQQSKLSLFNPDAISETNFTAGRHKANPQGIVCYPNRDELLNLHYKWVALEYVLNRTALLRTGLGEMDRAKKWGFHYDRSRSELAAEHSHRLAEAIEIITPGRDHHCFHGEPRWWRTEA